MKRAVPYLILAVVSAVFLYPFVRFFNDAPDAGVYVNGADLVRRGAIPSRDFVELQGPGSFVWLALFFKLFGTTLETARAVLNGTGVAIGLLAFYLSRRLGASGFFAALFVMVMTVPVSPINSPHYDSGLFALAALAMFLPARTWKLAASAALCGVTAWTIQQKGCYLALGLFVSLLCLPRRKPAVTFASVFAAVALLPFVFFAALHALPDVLFANYIWPMTSYSHLNAATYGFPIWQNLRETWNQQGRGWGAGVEDLALTMPFFLVAALPVLLPVAAFASGRRWLQKPVLPYWLAAYALWISELHRLDMGHLRNGVMVMAILFFSICEAGGNNWLKRAGLALSMCVGLAGVTNFLTSWENNHRIETRRGVVYAKQPQPLLDFLKAHTRDGEEVFIYPYQPIYYFVEDLRNPTRYSNLTYGFNSDAQFLEATQDLERKKVRYVVFDGLFSGQGMRRVFPAYREPDKSRLIMENYLAAHYRVAADLGRFRVLERSMFNEHSP